MRAKERIINDLNESTQEVLKTVDGTPDEIFNRQTNGKWSAAGHLAHLAILEALTVNIMKGETTTLEDRNENRRPDSRVRLIERVFGDMDRKLQAPQAIAPKEGEKDKGQLRQQFSTSREQMIEIIENQDLDLLCLGFKHAFFKELTRYEWIYFTIFHSGRHTKQISGIT